MTPTDAQGSDIFDSIKYFINTPHKQKLFYTKWDTTKKYKNWILI